MKEENEKVSLKLDIQKMKIMTSGPITSWEIDGETVEIVSDFIPNTSQETLNFKKFSGCTLLVVYCLNQNIYSNHISNAVSVFILIRPLMQDIVTLPF